MLPLDVAEIRIGLARLFPHRPSSASEAAAERVVQLSQLMSWIVDAAELAGVNTADTRAVVLNARKRWPGLEKLIEGYRKDGVELLEAEA